MVIRQPMFNFLLQIKEWKSTIPRGFYTRFLLSCKYACILLQTITKTLSIELFKMSSLRVTITLQRKEKLDTLVVIHRQSFCDNWTKLKIYPVPQHGKGEISFKSILGTCLLLYSVRGIRRSARKQVSPFPSG